MARNFVVQFKFCINFKLLIFLDKSAFGRTCSFAQRGAFKRVFQHILRPVDGILDIHHPVVGVALIKQLLDAAAGTGRLCLARENHLFTGLY